MLPRLRSSAESSNHPRLISPWINPGALRRFSVKNEILHNEMSQLIEKLGPEKMKQLLQHDWTWVYAMNFGPNYVGWSEHYSSWYFNVLRTHLAPWSELPARREIGEEDAEMILDSLTPSIFLEVMKGFDHELHPHLMDAGVNGLISFKEWALLSMEINPHQWSDSEVRELSAVSLKKVGLFLAYLTKKGQLTLRNFIVLGAVEATWSKHILVGKQ